MPRTPKDLATFYRSLLLRVKWHAEQHYEQFVKVIADWEGDIKHDLVKTLPTDQKPTSLQVLEIKQAIGALVAGWVDELGYRMKLEAYKWEMSDYPVIEAQMKRDPRVSVFMPTGFSYPRTRGCPLRLNGSCP